MDLRLHQSTVVREVGGWEAPVLALGALAIVLVAAANLWQLWRSGASTPRAAPFTNFDWRYLEAKYGRAWASGAQRCHAAKPAHHSRDHAVRVVDGGPPYILDPAAAEDDDDDGTDVVGELSSTALDSSLSRRGSLGRYGSMGRSFSAESLNSVSSIGQDFGCSDGPAAQLEVCVEMEARAGLLAVTLLQGKELGEAEGVPVHRCFVQLGLRPGNRVACTSKVHHSAASVPFDERLVMPLDAAAADDTTLAFTALGLDNNGRQLSMGTAELRLGDLDLSVRPFSTWLYLQDSSQAECCGEVLLSLSYLPTAERLTVVVVKAKGLEWPQGRESGAPFVKVYLLQGGRKVSKKKTVTKRDERNPVYNDAIIFSVPASTLQDISLRVTVADHSEGTRAENIGHAVIGPQSSGVALAHWQQMLATLRRPVSMWHPLRKSHA
ncbi:unnamed protein product [Lampetra planeri]